jgi:hypothetical protein
VAKPGAGHRRREFANANWEHDRRDKRILDMWMRCYSQGEIAEAAGISQPTVAEVVSEFSDVKKLIKSDLAAPEHATDFEPPVYNIWKQQEKRGANLRMQIRRARGTPGV